MTNKIYQQLAALTMVGALTFGGGEAIALASTPVDTSPLDTTSSPSIQGAMASAAAPSGEEMPVGDLPGWRQIFTDDFTTDVPLGSFPAAVSSQWTAYPSPWKDTSGYGTYSPTKVISVSGGILSKDIHTENGQAMVAAISPKLSSPVTYGRYAVRFRFDSLPDYKIAWLLWPDSNNSQRDGEIDFPEMNLDSSTAWGFNHHTNNTGAGDQDWFNTPLPQGEWHTAVIEWSPNLVLFRFDGVEVGRTSERVAAAAMHWVLQTETEIHLTAPPAASVRGNVQIDWAAVWAYDPSTADTTAPVTAISSPITGSTVSKSTTVSATASDNKGVVGVQFQLDGARLGQELTTATGPYSTTWNTELSTAGPHTLTVVARDDAGNMTTSTPVIVTVANLADTTPPTATYIPKSSSTIFPVAAHVYATFSEAVTGVNGNSFSLKNTTTGATIPATVTYTVNANSSKAELHPFNDLSADTKYTATLTSAINDTSGNTMVTSSWSFVTGPRPTALPTLPASNATNVSATTNITATASETLTKFGSTTFLVKSSSGTAIAGALTFDTSTKQLTFNPTVTLAANTKYTVSLTSGIKDVAGNPLLPLTWSFTTGAGGTVDTTPPAVTVSPTANATVFPVGSSLYPVFNEGVTGVNGSSFSLKNATTDAVVPATVTASASGAKLDPTASLTADTLYSATLTSAIEDGAGNALSPTTWSFLTGPRPTAVPTSPVSNATAVSRTTNITATASETLTRVGNTTFLLKSSGGTAISGAVAFNTSTKQASLDPSVTLAANTTYTVSMTSNIKDVAGNPLLPLTWSFTTGS